MLHAFAKRTRKTPKHDLELAIETLIDMLGRLGVQVRLVVKPTRRRQVA